MSTDDPGRDLDDDAVRQANGRFYQALEQADLELMRQVWVNDDRASCAHPGRRALQGWDEVWASWEAILNNEGNPQVILTEEVVHRSGSVAWITAIENMISGQHTGAAAALNVFEYDGTDWRMVAHHAAPILSR